MKQLIVLIRRTEQSNLMTDAPVINLRAVRSLISMWRNCWKVVRSSDGCRKILKISKHGAR